MGIEVLLRMGKSSLFWEFGKYAVVYFILLGLIRKSKKVNLNIPILYYLLLLSLSIILVPYISFNQWRQEIASRDDADGVGQRNIAETRGSR